MYKLSILICTLNEPFYIRGLKRLKEILDPQVQKYSNHVEVLIHDAGRSMTTGRKRNELIDQSNGEYFVFIDSDDIVSEKYVERILFALEKNPDVVTFEGAMTSNGGPPKKFIIKLGSDYVDKNGVYLRWPNHLSVMRRSAVQDIKFPDVTIQEDFRWSKEIRDKGRLKTSCHLAEDLYQYDHWDYRLRK